MKNMICESKNITIISEGCDGEKAVFTSLAHLQRDFLLSRFSDSHREQGNSVEHFIQEISNDLNWENLVLSHSVLKPIKDLIANIEKDDCDLSDVYNRFKKLFNTQFADNIREKIIDRWNFIHTESMGFAYLLDPSTKGGEDMVGEDKPNTIDELV